MPIRAEIETRRRAPDHAGLEPVTLLGVPYWREVTADGGDLYLTAHGLPYRALLQPANWREDPWFRDHRERLAGTSVVYRVPTKPVGGRSLDVVVKWCRIGEEVPCDTMTFQKFAEAEFNGPYEEFSLLTELRESPGPRLFTNRPLAIFVPPERLKLWQTGRSRSKIDSHLAKFREIELDLFRQYIFLYHWVDGVDAAVALESAIPDEAARRAEVARLTQRVHEDLSAKGFCVIDHKPAHVILRPRRDGTLLRDPDTDDYAYALIDFELLTRTPEHEAAVLAGRRAEYLRGQRDRFAPRPPGTMPPHLHEAKVFGVDYVCGVADSTDGMLWVVGRDPHLFDFFLPERWRRTARRQISRTNETFQTMTKDTIHLVWKVSRVGELPDPAVGPAAAEYGYNSPFEEVAISLELAEHGIPATYPRAIYMCGIESARDTGYPSDPRRYESHAGLTTPDGRPLLSTEHSYLTVWGYWNGLVEALAMGRQPYCDGVNLLDAWTAGLITSAQMDGLIERLQARLRVAGFEFVAPKPTHILLSRLRDGTLVEDASGELCVRVCNFQSIRRLPAPGGS